MLPLLSRVATACLLISGAWAADAPAKPTVTFSGTLHGTVAGIAGNRFNLYVTDAVDDDGRLVPAMSKVLMLVGVAYNVRNEQGQWLVNPEQERWLRSVKMNDTASVKVKPNPKGDTLVLVEAIVAK